MYLTKVSLHPFEHCAKFLKIIKILNDTLKVNLSLLPHVDSLIWGFDLSITTNMKKEKIDQEMEMKGTKKNQSRRLDSESLPLISESDCSSQEN